MVLRTKSVETFSRFLLHATHSSWDLRRSQATDFNASLHITHLMHYRVSLGYSRKEITSTAVPESGSRKALKSHEVPWAPGLEKRWTSRFWWTACSTQYPLKQWGQSHCPRTQAKKPRDWAARFVERLEIYEKPKHLKGSSNRETLRTPHWMKTVMIFMSGTLSLPRSPPRDNWTRSRIVCAMYTESLDALSSSSSVSQRFHSVSQRAASDGYWPNMIEKLSRLPDWSRAHSVMTPRSENCLLCLINWWRSDFSHIIVSYCGYLVIYSASLAIGQFPRGRIQHRLLILFAHINFRTPNREGQKCPRLGAACLMSSCDAP